jgi:hypothetical protein
MGCDYRRGLDRSIEFIDYLYTPLRTTSNYIATANLHTLQSLGHAKSSQFAFTSRFLVTDLNNGDSSASMLTSLLSGEYLATELSHSPIIYFTSLHSTEQVKVKVTLRLTVGQSVSKSWCGAPSRARDQIFSTV